MPVLAFRKVSGQSACVKLERSLIRHSAGRFGHWNPSSMLRTTSACECLCLCVWLCKCVCVCVFLHVSVVYEGPTPGPLQDIVEEILQPPVEGIPLGSFLAPRHAAALTPRSFFGCVTQTGPMLSFAQHRKNRNEINQSESKTLRVVIATILFMYFFAHIPRDRRWLLIFSNISSICP